jgi:restriction endonuclease S subunit
MESGTGKLIKVSTAGNQNVSGPVYRFTGKRLLYSKIRPYLNKLSIVDIDGYCSSDMYPIDINDSAADIDFIAYYMNSNNFLEKISCFYERSSIPKINRNQLFQTRIPLPPLDVQRRIVAEIQEERKLVDANRELVERFERKIQKTIDRVWGEGESR